MVLIENETGQFWGGKAGALRFGSFPMLAPLLARGVGLRYTDQIHGNGVLDDDNFGFCGQAADGLISQHQNLALVIRTADCIPLHIWDGQKIGMVHAGWRGVKANITTRSIQDFKTSIVQVIIGPSISARHYQVDSDLYAPWLNQWPALENHLSKPLPGSSKRYLDLRQVVRQQLLDAGVSKENIYSIPNCTFASALPSYRREGKRAKRIYNYIYRVQA